MLSGLGFVDVAAAAHSLGAGGPLASQANEYAAMPSLHVAWALWCTFAVWAVRKDRPTRMVAAGYAVLTVVLAMATANHYFFDVVRAQPPRPSPPASPSGTAGAGPRLSQRRDWPQRIAS